MQNMNEKLNKSDLKMMRQYCAYFGSIGGSSTSEAKRRASRENAVRARAVRLEKLGKVVQK